MGFMKVIIKQQSEGTPGFAGEEKFEIQISSNKVTMFNKSESGDEVFVRLACGATLCIDMSYGEFIKKLNTAIKNHGGKVIP